MIQQAIKQNQFSVVKAHITTHQEPNLLHQAIFHQKEKIILLLIHEGWDVNAIEKGWSPITLAVWTKNYTVTQILLSQQNIDVNFISPQGTALHIAARNDDEKIVNLLLKHPNLKFNLKFQQKYALDIAGKRTADLIRNEIEQRSNIETFRTSVTQYIFLSQNNVCKNYIQTLLMNMPPKPPLVKGFVNKVHRFFKLRQYERYMIIDPESGFLARYKQAKDEPMNPCELISLLNIKSVKLTKDHWWENGQQYFKIKYGKRKLFFSNYYKQTSEKWVDYIKKSIIYYRYVNNKLQDYWENLDNYKIEQAIAEICRRENIIIELKDDSLIDPNVQIKQKVVQIQNQVKKQSFERISEQSQFEEGEQGEIGLQDLKIEECIGKGSFGYVFKVQYQNKLYALKQQSKQQLKSSGNLKYATAEAHILNKCYHPFLMNCISAFQTQQNLYLLMDYCANGDLAQYMTRGTIWDEYTAKYYIAEILIGIEYLHSKNIIYRDLKPENIAIGDDGHIKILDFGLSKENMYENVLTSTFCGSPAYLPPEVLLNQGTNKKSDIYGIGTLLFEMLTGYPPHYSNNIDKLIYNIKTQRVELPKNISEPCRLVLKDTLLKPRDERPSAKTLKKYEFFSGIEFSKLETKQIKLPPIKKVHPVSRKLQAIVFQDDDQQSDNDFIKSWNFIR